MLFIVKGVVRKRGYMSSCEESEEVMHPVEAEDATEASDIFVEHYEGQSQSYSVSYSASVIEVFETLSRKQ
jgi:hypothetical protein